MGTAPHFLRLQSSCPACSIIRVCSWYMSQVCIPTLIGVGQFQVLLVSDFSWCVVAAATICSPPWVSWLLQPSPRWWWWGWLGLSPTPPRRPFHLLPPPWDYQNICWGMPVPLVDFPTRCHLPRVLMLAVGVLRYTPSHIGLFHRQPFFFIVAFFAAAR